jgi:hypothetical protein
MNLSFSAILFAALLLVFAGLGAWMLFAGIAQLLSNKKQGNTTVGVAKGISGFVIILCVILLASIHANSKPSGTIDTGGNSNTTVVVGDE